MRDYKKLETFLCNFIKDYCKKSDAKGVVLGLSGGIDSALVAYLCKKALKNEVFALLMPTNSSKKENLQDALDLCLSLGLRHKIINIEEILSSFLSKCQDIDKIRKGNLAARIRMSLLYDYSALFSYLVIGTSNKSELKLGYGTIYGDLAHAFNPIANLYKSEIFSFASFLNLPEVFIKKAPSADLYEDQSDELDLGFSYEDIDKVLMAMDKNEDLSCFDERLLKMIKTRMQKNAFKLKMPEFANIDEV